VQLLIGPKRKVNLLLVNKNNVYARRGGKLTPELSNCEKDWLLSFELLIIAGGMVIHSAEHTC
jgi:hypothetical protein